MRHVQLDDREAEHGRNGLRTGTRSPGTTRLRNGTRIRRILAAKHGSAIESAPGLKVPIFLLDLRAPFARAGAPLRGFEARRRRIPSSEAQVTVIAIDDEDV